MSGPLRRRGRHETDPVILAIDEEIRMAIADVLDALREARAWTQADMARAAKLTPTTVGDILRAKRRTDIPSLIRLGRAVGRRLVVRFEEGIPTT